MSFASRLNEFMLSGGVNASELAELSGLNISTINRYRNGKREPGPDSDQLRAISAALAKASKEGSKLDEQAVCTQLLAELTSGLSVSYESYLKNLQLLLKELGIRSVSLAKAMAYDPSHISKILSGQRRPGDIGKFNQQLTEFIAQRYSSEQDIATLARITGTDAASLNDSAELQLAVSMWLGSNSALPAKDPLAGFLEKLESFDLDEFINSIHFSDIKLPTAPFQLPTTKVFTGLDGMKISEIEFEKATVLSRSADDCILFSNMPIEKMSEDTDFAKKWMFGMAMMLKKGLHLNIIHDVDRPFSEMMLGLEGNIPLYMTGQISPYYFTSPWNAQTTYLLKVSGGAALEGTSIKGHHASGRYTLYKSKEDIRGIRVMAQQLLSRAVPLMDIYRSDRSAEFRSRLEELYNGEDLRIVSGGLPIWTISEELLEEILSAAGTPEDEKAEIFALRSSLLALAEKLLSGNSIAMEVPELSEEEFNDHPAGLQLSEIFLENDIPCSFAQYQRHLEQTKRFAKEHSKLTLLPDSSPAFRNITFTVIGEKHVVVSKIKSPAIHFVIHHRNMVRAFRSFVPPVKD